MDSAKSILRRRLLEQRRGLSPEVWREWSDRICLQIQTSPQFSLSQTILVYQSCNQEPDLRYLFNHTDKQWGLPRCVGKDLSWHRWQPQEPLITGRYGILEPAPTSPQLEPNSVDLMLVPAVAVDRRGYRLGYGGGYYDRLRADPLWRKVSSVGIVFDFAYLDIVPIDPWDLPLDAVCTELGIVLTG